MTFCHKSTFLRSAILEDPFSLGDLIGPEDVLRIENEFPDLFQPPEFDFFSSDGKSNDYGRPRSKPTTAPFDKLSQISKGCTRERCKVEFENQLSTLSIGDRHGRKFVREPIQKSFARPNRQISGSQNSNRKPAHINNNKSSTEMYSLSSPLKVPVVSDRISRLALPKSHSTGSFQHGLLSSQRPASSCASFMDNRFEADPTLPNISPRVPVSARHTSKSRGFLKPSPILMRKKNQKTMSSSVSFLDFKENREPVSRLAKTKDQPQATTCNQLSLALPALRALIDQRFKPQLERSKQQNGHVNGGDKLRDALHDFANVKPTKFHYNSNAGTDATELEGNKAKNDSLLSDIFEYSEENTENLDSSMCASDFLDISNSQQCKVISYKSRPNQDLPTKEQEQEDYLTQASMNRCEQLLLAKLLASRYESDGKFKKPQNSSQTKYKQDQVSSKPMHFMLLDNFEQQNKGFEALAKNYPTLLEKIACELIHAEVTKIMHEEEGNGFLMTGKRNKVDVGVGTRVHYADREYKTKTDKNVHSDKNLFPSQKSKVSNVDNGRAEQDDYESDFIETCTESEEENTIATPELTPPDRQKVHLPISKPSKFSADEGFSHMLVQTPTLSRPPTPPEPLNSKILQKQKQKENDLTDCSELEDFVASEPIVHHNFLKQNVDTQIIEECITNIPTPIFSTPTPNSLSEAAGGRYTELLKQFPESVGTAAVIGKSDIIFSKPLSCDSTNGDEARDIKCALINTNGNPNSHDKEEDSRRDKEKETVDEQSSVKSGPKSKSVNFDLDTSEVHSSFASVLEMISEGELIVPTGERSPGEVSCAFNISPGMHFYRSSSSSSTTNDHSTYGFE